MQGELLPVTIEWIILALAPILAFATCLRDILWSRGIFGFRNGMAGPASAVTRTGLGDDFTDTYDQLTRLGFKPEGVYWESAAFMPKFLEYIFVDPQRNCFAAVYRQFGKDINVVLMTSFQDGTFIKTRDTPGDVVDEPDRIINRLPSQPVADLLAAHEASEARLIAEGRTLRNTRNLDAITHAQQLSFFHPPAFDEMCGIGGTMLSVKLGMMACCAGPLSLLALFFFMSPVIRTMLLLGAAAWVITVSVLFLSMGLLIKLFSTGEKKEVDETPEPAPFMCYAAKHLFWGTPLLLLAVWQFGAADVALGMLIIVSMVAAIDLIRIFVWGARSPFASASPKADV